MARRKKREYPRGKRWFLFLVFIGVVCVAVYLYNENARLRKLNRELQKRLESLSVENRDLKAKISDLQVKMTIIEKSPASR